MDLVGKNVVYVGGFGGIGRKCVKEFLVKGVQNVVILDLNEDKEIMKELQSAFPVAHIYYIAMDITDKSSIEAAYKQVAEHIGHFDVVVNGSGLMDDRDVDLCLQINLIGLMHSSLTANRYMDKNAGGHGGLIVNISSVVGLEPTAMYAIYSTAKFGVTAFTRNMGNPLYYNHTGVGFIGICPGFTETPLLDNPGEKQTFAFTSFLSERFNRVQRQTPEVCARNLVKAVEIAKNGSVWLLDLGEMHEVEFPSLWKPTLNA